MQFHSAKAVVQAYKAGHLASNARKAVDIEMLMELVRMNGFNVTEEWVREVLNEESPAVEIVNGWEADWGHEAYDPAIELIEEIEEAWGRAIECVPTAVGIAECEAILASFMGDVYDSIAYRVKEFDSNAKVAECYHEAIMAISDHLAAIRGFAYGEVEPVELSEKEYMVWLNGEAFTMMQRTRDEVYEDFLAAFGDNKDATDIQITKGDHNNEMLVFTLDPFWSDQYSAHGVYSRVRSALWPDGYQLPS